MARTESTIKNVTTSLRTTVDMDRIIKEAADRIGASKGEIYRLGAYETAMQILADDCMAERLSLRFSI